MVFLTVACLIGMIPQRLKVLNRVSQSWGIIFDKQHLPKSAVELTAQMCETKAIFFAK